MRRPTLLAALALTAACALAACGSSGPTAEEEAEAIAIRAPTNSPRA